MPAATTNQSTDKMKSIVEALTRENPFAQPWDAASNKVFHAMRNATISGSTGFIAENFTIRDGSDLPADILPKVRFV